MNHPKHHQLQEAVWSAGSIDASAGDKQVHAPSIRHLWCDESGQDLIEYALVAALVGLGALAAMRGLKNSVSNTFNSIGNSLTSAAA